MANDLSELRSEITSVVKDVLCNDGVLRPASGAAAYAIRVNLRRPTEATVLQGASVVLARPIAKVAVIDVPSLVKNDVIVTENRQFRVAAAPTRPGSGQWWEAPVEDIGAA